MTRILGNLFANLIVVLLMPGVLILIAGLYLVDMILALRNNVLKGQP